METNLPEIDGSMALEGGSQNGFQVIAPTREKKTTDLQQQVVENTRLCMTRQENCQPNCDGKNCVLGADFQERVTEIIEGKNVGLGGTLRPSTIVTTQTR